MLFSVTVKVKGWPEFTNVVEAVGAEEARLEMEDAMQDEGFELERPVRVEPKFYE